MTIQACLISACVLRTIPISALLIFAAQTELPFFILIMQAVSLKKMKINKQNNFTYLDLCARGKSKRET